MTPHEQAQAWAFRILHQTARLQSETLKRSVPVPLPERSAPVQTKPGTRREPPTPRGQGPCKRWGVR
jgi:hypothetical protein